MLLKKNTTVGQYVGLIFVVVISCAVIVYSDDIDSLKFGELRDCNVGGSGLHVNLTYTPNKLRPDTKILITGGNVRLNVKPADGFNAGHFETRLSFDNHPHNPIVTWTDRASCEMILGKFPHGATEGLGLFAPVPKCPGLLTGFTEFNIALLKKKMTSQLPSDETYFILGGHYYVRIRLFNQNNNEYLCLHGKLNIENTAGSELKKAGDHLGQEVQHELDKIFHG
jgi:hypothetical protein